MSGGLESCLHMEQIISSTPKQGVSILATGWSKYWIEQNHIQEHCYVWATLGSYWDSGLTMFGCDWMDYMESRSWEENNPKLWG